MAKPDEVLEKIAKLLRDKITERKNQKMQQPQDLSIGVRLYD